MGKLQKFLCMVLIGLYGLTPPVFAQNIAKIYASNESDKSKNEKIGTKQFTGAEGFATAQIRYAAFMKPEPLQKWIWGYEALTPNMKQELGTAFKGINEFYETEGERATTLFQFTRDIYPKLTLAELESAGKLKKSELPTTRTSLLRYYTAKVHYDLMTSQNLQIAPSWKRIKELFSSMNKSEQDSFETLGYKEFWKEQLACYDHKMGISPRNCICGGTAQTMTAFRDCPNTKELRLNYAIASDSIQTSAVLDNATRVLLDLNNGDFTFIKEAHAQKLSVWGNAQSDIITQLVYLQLAALGETQMTDQMDINLVELWDKKESMVGGNRYLKLLGLTREIIQGIESYYACILQADKVAERQPAVATTTSRPPQQTNETPAPTSNSRPQKVVYKAANLKDAVQTNLLNLLQKHRPLKHTCLTTEAVNDTTYQVILKGCDSTKQIFPIGEYEVPAIADFFYYCSDVVDEELGIAAEKVPMQYSIKVKGTADIIRSSRNDVLANNRATYIADNLSPNTKKNAVAINTEKETDRPVGERYVILTFFLHLQ